LIHFATITAVFLSAWVELARINQVKGRWLNVPKWVSVLIGAVLFGVVLLIYGLNNWYFILPEMLFVRATFYDPFLNKLRGLKWDYISPKTNSWLDDIEAKVKAYFKRRFNKELNFMAERIFYGILALIFLILYEWF